MRIAKALATCLVLAALPLSARTIALWPLNWNGETGNVNCRCALDVDNNLTADPNLGYAQGQGAELGWALPPNPNSRRRWRFTPTHNSVTYSDGASEAKNFAYSGSFGRYVSVTNDFTIEGWCRFPALPASGGLFFVVSCDGSNTAGNSSRWFLTLRNNNPANSGVTWQIYSNREATGDAILATLSDGQIDALTNRWCHFALSHERRSGDAIWRIYQDGVLLGSKTCTRYAGNLGSAVLFSLGGRNLKGNVFTGSLAYCRVSDRVLAPAEFLNAVGDTHETVALWKLDRDSYGGISGAPSVGDVHLTGGFVNFHTWNLTNADYSDSKIYSDSDCAFTGNPPNPSVVLPNGNVGSLFARTYSKKSRQVIHDIGSELSLTNDFTVEGWLKLECRDFAYEVETSRRARQLCGTRIDKIGWVFQFRRWGGADAASITVQDEAGMLMADAPLGDISACEGKWAHVALVYSHAAGENATGVWSCYVDGTLTGSATNSVAPRGGGVDSKYRRLALGPMAETEIFALPGKLDCWRASKSALQPVQFMCTTNGTAATDVLAIWPMNAQNGIYIDGTDVATGAYTFEEPLGLQYMATACDGAPEVPGVSTASNGSAAFRVDGNGSRSYLLCNDESTAAMMANTGNYTFETYLYRTEQLTGSDYEFILLTSRGGVGQFTGNNIGTLYMNLTYRSYGFQLFARGVFSSDQKFVDGNGQDIMLPLNTWTHLALTYRIENGNGIFDLYLDGVKKGTLSNAVTVSYTPERLYLGGRYTTDSSWRGKMSTIRLSRGALEPSEFLCARSATPESRAYWPLEGASALDLTGRINGVDGMNDFTAWSAVTGLAAGAWPRVPRPDTSTNFTGNASANAGAVQLEAGGYAQANETGTHVDLDDSFTAEGWIRWARSQGAVAEVVCGTYADGKGGWKLVLDSTGATPTLRLRADGEFPVSALADGVLMADASSLEGTWHHLALRYDTTVGDGVWSLLVDGEAAGSVTNAWRPSSFLARAEFRLGAFGGDTSFVGGYDMWRISRGVRSVDDILWMPPKGTLMIFR